MKKIFLLLATSVCLFACEKKPGSYSYATKNLHREVYNDHRISFYCGCKYTAKQMGNGKKLTPDLESCGYKPRQDSEQADRIVWSHVMSAKTIGQYLGCWGNNTTWDYGRVKGCRLKSVFRKMEADMHNIVPTVGEIDLDRRSFKFGLIDNEHRQFGKCDFEVDFKLGIVEPADSLRGDIARIYFYMEDRYKIKISEDQRLLMSTWDEIDPVDSWERERNKRIKNIQGNGNKFVESY